MLTLNIIGTGKVGRTLGALWQSAGVFELGAVLSRTPDSARAAVTFIGRGTAANDMRALTPANVWMLTLPDDRIADRARALAASGVLREGDIVFHCSGALSSSELAAVRTCGAHIGSIHPVKSFAEPAVAVASFAGTWCAAEGDEGALTVLQPAFERIGAHVTRIAAASKLLYHAANVIASNYLVALAEAALRVYAHAGIGRENAAAIMAPLVRETAENVLEFGPAQALTGPIARGDAALVARQLDALEQADSGLAALYRQLGSVALELARAQHKADVPALDDIAKLLTRDS